MSLVSNQPKGSPHVRRMHWEKTWASQASTNSYVDLGTYWDKTGFQVGTIQIWNTGDTNDINYKVWGSLNGSDFDIPVVEETTVGEDEFDLVDISNLSEGAYIPYILIQIQSTSSGNHSTVEAFGVCI